MNKNNRFRWIIVVLITAWAISSFYPPGSRDLVQVFTEMASNKDTNFSGIITQARALEQELPGHAYGNLRTAIGTNDISQYFPNIKPTGDERDLTRVILNRVQKNAAGKVKLGLDLQGGTSFLVGVDTTRATGTNGATLERQAVLEQAVEVLRKRVDRFGVAEPLLQPVGDNRILIQMPGLSETDVDTVKNTIQKAAFLEFRMVHPESQQLLAQGLSAPGYDKLTEVGKDKKGQPYTLQYLVKRGAEKGLTGKYVERATVSRDQMSNLPEILLRFDSPGADLFGQITKANVGRQMAIVLDGVLYSAPVIKQPILNGSASISGGMSDIKQAFELANVLENPLEAPVKIEDSRVVGPSLGKDSIESGVKSALYGVIAVAGFMLIYYMMAGAIANVALLVNLIVLVGILCSMGTTFTLPGIAGIVLTAGMAVDANVLIYERIREELAAGKSMRGAIAAGYSKAFWTIFDSHITTLITSIILYFNGTGPVKGFGLSLGVGVAVSLFTALIVTRLIFDFLLARDKVKSLRMLHLVKGSKIDFMKLAKPAFAVSWMIILVGVGWGIKRGGDIMGVDFKGGDSLTLSYQGALNTSKAREVINKAAGGEASFQETQLTSGKGVMVTAPYGKGPGVLEALNTELSENKFKLEAKEEVGPAIGAEILRSAILSLLLAMFGILVYIAMRYEFSFAVGAIVAILHDVLMTMGCFFLTGRELNAPIVAAVLTIIGFSINDTIVIFDRIREDLKLGIRGSFKDIMNKALNETLSRTIITSGTVFLATASLYFFGGPVINDFAFTFLVGILTGTYSSIYIASALVLWWHKGERPQLGATGTPTTIDNSVTARA